MVVKSRAGFDRRVPAENGASLSAGSPPPGGQKQWSTKIYRAIFTLKNRPIDYFLLRKMAIFFFISNICSSEPAGQPRQCPLGFAG
jgi:hypothetical protein